MQSKVLDRVRVDGDDLTDTLLRIEKSFCIELPQDLRHVETAGDLFDEVLALRQPTGEGNRCDTQMAFYLLRRELVQFGLASNAKPSLELKKQELPFPRALRKWLEHDLGLEAPSLELTRLACSLAIASGLAAFAISVAMWSIAPFFFLVATIPILILDRGAWTGPWETLGTLSEAVALSNVANFQSCGARDGKTDWWKRFALMLAKISLDPNNREVSHNAIGPMTRFDFS